MLVAERHLAAEQAAGVGDRAEPGRRRLVGEQQQALAEGVVGRRLQRLRLADHAGEVADAQLDALVATVATPEEGESLRALVTKRAQLNRSLAEVSAGDSDILDATSSIRRAHSELLQQEQATWQALSGRLSGPAQARAASLQQEAARLGIQDSKLQALSGRLDRLLDVKVAEVQSTVVGERERMAGEARVVGARQSELDY